MSQRNPRAVAAAIERGRPPTRKSASTASLARWGNGGRNGRPRQDLSVALSRRDPERRPRRRRRARNSFVSLAPPRAQTKRDGRSLMPYMNASKRRIIGNRAGDARGGASLPSSNSTTTRPFPKQRGGRPARHLWPLVRVDDGSRRVQHHGLHRALRAVLAPIIGEHLPLAPPRVRRKSRVPHGRRKGC